MSSQQMSSRKRKADYTSEYSDMGPKRFRVNCAGSNGPCREEHILRGARGDHPRANSWLEPPTYNGESPTGQKLQPQHLRSSGNIIRDWISAIST
ncbi:hypothetical protein TWF102_000228 [Orbilia oligospora]|uniref:Uncharacterized protein n=1 Tax=Orbilia oligospora TaxID=2813651 RepID=A0A7C8NKY3_ORBOL|nr:hypothetical protein TWF102_000228 [Orbilia oligospora]KAF3115329.1 hypothetical protein TWF103_011587 [Orbilia oligospora]KAF3116779.1 hypothetical protein TWF706_000004 [Orbilia oligospora]